MAIAVGEGKQSFPAPRRNAEHGWARLFGYDIFISFALGPPPRGTRSYASDLARRLRELGFTVFFSEDEAPAGGELDRTLRKALHASRIVVLVANHGTLREPRWVRTEVEEFRRRHPKRPVVPISIDGALRDPELGLMTAAWLPFAQRIWIDESRDAGEAGSVSDDVIQRLITAPHAVRSSVRLRAAVGALITFFAILAAVALWQREVAEDRQRIAQSRELAVSATAALGSDPERAALLAMTGVELSPTHESQGALRAALLEPRGRRVVKGVAGPLWDVAYSPEGSRLLAVGDGGAVVTNLTDGAVTATLRKQRLRRVTLGRDGRFAVVSDAAGNEHMWRLGPGAATSTAEFPPLQRRAVLSPDSNLAVTFGDGDCARLWSLMTGAPALELCGHQERVRSAAFNPTGTVLLSSSGDRVVRAWETATGRILHELQAPLPGARVSFSPDGRFAAAISSTGTVQLWDTHAWKPAAMIDAHYPLVDAVFSQDGDYLVVVETLGSEAKVFRTSDGSELARLVGHTGRIFSAAFSPLGDLLVTSSEDKTARVWNARTGGTIATLRGHAGIVTKSRFSPDGRRIVTASLDGTARVWEWIKFTDVLDLNPGGPRLERTRLGAGERVAWFVDSQGTLLSLANEALRPLARVTRDVRDVAVSTDGRMLATVDRNGSMRLISLADGALVAEWPRELPMTAKLSFSPDGKRLLSVENTVTLWDVERRQRLANLEVRSRPSKSEFSPDGRYLITIEGDAAVLREGRRGGFLARLGGQSGHGVTSARFSPDGASIVTTSVDRTVRLWSASAPTSARELKGHTDAVLDAWFSPDGTSVVSVGQDQTARVWDVVTAHALSELRGERDNWEMASFHPGNALVLTSGGHNPAALWDARTGTRLLQFAADSQAAFTPDGRYIVVVADGRAKLYRCPECGGARELTELTHARVERALSTEERRVFLHEAPGSSMPQGRK